MALELNINLTGYQIVRILDGLLLLGVESMFKTTRFVELHIPSLLSWSVRNKRRKISSAAKEVQVSALMNILVSNDPDEKLKAYRSFRADRYITTGIMELFLKACEGYREAVQTGDTEKAESIERQMGCHQCDALYGAVNTVESALKMAYDFRNMIVNKYTGLCRQYASKVKAKAVIGVDERDLAQNLANAVIIAINKYDYRKGALTSYLVPWFRYLSQSPKFSHEMGLAYDIPHNYRSRIRSDGKSNIGNALNDDTEETLESSQAAVTTSLENEQEEKRLLRILQIADPRGLVRLPLNIDEYVSEKHLRQMARQMMAERGHVVAQTVKPKRPLKKLRRVLRRTLRTEAPEKVSVFRALWEAPKTREKRNTDEITFTGERKEGRQDRPPRRSHGDSRLGQDERQMGAFEIDAG